MALYKTFNIKYTEGNGPMMESYEVAENVAGALAKFNEEVNHSMIKVWDVWEDDMTFGYVLTDDEGDQFWYGFADESALFYDLSKTLAFDDCCPYFTIDGIKCGGRSVRYVGWQPNLVFEYRYNDTNEIAYMYQNISWEH